MVRYLDIKEAFQAWSDWYGLRAKEYEATKARRWEPVYRRLVKCAGIAAGSKVLDIGTGTGGAALEAAKAAGSHGYVIGTDSADGMLSIAKEKSEKLGITNVEFK